MDSKGQLTAFSMDGLDQEVSEADEQRAQTGAAYLADFVDYAKRIANDAQRLQNRYNEYLPEIERGSAPYSLRDDALSLGSRMQLKGLELSGAMLRALSEDPITIGMSESEIFATHGALSGHVKDGVLYMKMPLPVKTYALRFAGSSRAVIRELDALLDALDLQSMALKSRYIFAFTFVHPKGGDQARDHDNYYIKPVIDTICMHMCKTDSPAELNLALATVFSDSEEPCMKVVVKPIPEQKGITELAQEYSEQSREAIENDIK